MLLEDIARLKRVFRYIAGTLDLGITYRENTEKGVFESYSDANFGGCTKTGRSTSGVVIIPANMMTSIYRQIFVKSYVINDQNITSMGCKNHVEVSHTNDVI